jgi:Kef-type K+ transport system membrane component KefB
MVRKVPGPDIWPFMVLFFVLAGASLDLDSFDVIWGISIAYIVLRTFSRVIGGWLGGRLAGASVLHRRWIGLALIPQAGVALGMALVASNHFPDLAETLLAITIGTAIIFEVFGPILTLVTLCKVGEAKWGKALSE